MSSNLSNFDSAGGFSVNEIEVIDSTKNITNIHTMRIQNSNYSNSHKTSYILSGQNTGILSMDGASQLLPIENDTINFITAHVVGTNQTGGGVLVVKLESAVKCDNVGDVSSIGLLTTVIRDTIPSGQSWTVSAFDSGAVNKFSYSTTRTGTTDTIKWVAVTDIVSIDHS
jgi:hypothetical protein